MTKQFSLFEDKKYIAGVDEAGRGPLAGPVVAAAVILNPEKPIEGLADSKKLTPLKRTKIAGEIKFKALCWSIGIIDNAEIDRINILQASLVAMGQAILGLEIKPHNVLVDGNKCPSVPYPVDAIIGGDATIPVISAASILAKVTRDEEMMRFDELYPGYGFARHKGYPTKAHLLAMEKLGVCDIHRRSYSPVQRLIG